MKYRIKENIEKEIEVEKSRFIAYLFPCFSLNEFNEILKDIKKKHYKAKHACYAYIIEKENIKRGNDDKEPKGTAGIPLLSCLEKNNLVDSGVIVIRYFGGTLLGKGRLLRTYVESFEECFKEAKLLKLEVCNKVTVNVPYSLFDMFRSFLETSKISIINQVFNDKIFIEIITSKDFDLEIIKDKFLNKIKILKVEEYIDER